MQSTVAPKAGMRRASANTASGVSTNAVHRTLGSTPAPTSQVGITHTVPMHRIATPRLARGVTVVTNARRKSAAASAPILEEGAAGEGFDSAAKAALLAKVMSNIKKRFGEGSLQRLDDGGRVAAGVSTFSTGCFTLDLALGGGLPRGRVVEVFGPESCGKSTIALHAVAEVQRLGGNAVYIDVENALDPKYAASIGVDISGKGLVVSQPDCGEQALEIMDELARSCAVDLVIVDSVAALVPRAELEGEIGQQTIGLQARLLSSSLRKLCGSASKSGTTLLFINQIRNKVGVLYGSPETTSGGNALKYYSSVRIDLRKKEIITDGGNPTGIKVRAKIVKNKVAAPHKEAMFDIMFGRGIDSLASLIDGAEAYDVVKRKGSYYYYGDVKLGQGRDKAMESLREDPSLRAEVENAVRAALASNPDKLGGESLDGLGDGGLGDDDLGEEL